MNIREGARRMQYTGRMILSLAAAAFVLIILVAIISHYTEAFFFPGFQFIIVLAFFPAIFGTLLLIAGWITEGFAQPQHDPTPHEPAGD
jgi:hypothetical protein